MKNIINTTGLHTTNFINGRSGKFRAVVKCRAGFNTIVDGKDYHRNVMDIMTGYKKGALQTIEFLSEGTDHWLTVFALKGKKVVVVDEEILENITVGDINSTFLNTELYNQNQYQSVNAKTWVDKAYVMN